MVVNQSVGELKYSMVTIFYYSSFAGDDRAVSQVQFTVPPFVAGPLSFAGTSWLRDRAFLLLLLPGDVLW